MPNIFFKKACFFAALLLICSAAAHAEVVYNRGSVGDPATLDPHKTSAVTEADIMRDMFEGLIQRTAEGEAVPGAAESWTISDDGLVYTFKLRTDGKWSNGEPVTAQDFVYSFKRALDPATGSRTSANLYPIKNAEAINKGEMKSDELAARAVDDRTLEVNLRAPTPYFIELLTHQVTFPVHASNIEKDGADWIKPGKLVSNGPFVVSENFLKDHITLEKNKFYRNFDKIKIDKVRFIPIEDRGTGLKRFEAGEILSYEDIPTEQIDYIKQNYKDELRLAPYLGIYYYSFNTTKKPFDNPKLRQALSLAIDRDYIAEKIWGGTMFPAYNLVPPGMSGYTLAEADYKGKSQIEREDASRKIMEELGYSKDKLLPVEIRYNSGENHKNTAIAVADVWKNIYVETTMINVDAATHFRYLQEKGDFDIARAGWIADYKDPQNFLALAQTGNGVNYARFSNAEVDDWLRKAEAEVKPETRMGYLHKAEEAVVREAPIIPILFYYSKPLISKKLKGWFPNLVSVHPSQYIMIEN